MPTLSFLEALKSENAPPINLRGYDPDFWEALYVVYRSIENDQDMGLLPSKILRAGPCLGPSRIFFTITSDPDIPRRDELIKRLLETEVNCTRREFGMVFDDWVNRANGVVNKWLEERDRSVFDGIDIPSKLLEFYLLRLSGIEKLIDDLGLRPEHAKMDIQFKTDLSNKEDPLRLSPSIPDGLWRYIPRGYPGGIFETKLTIPPVHKYVAAGYAVHFEHLEQRAFNYAVFLELNEDEDRLNVESFPITDAMRDSVKENLEHFQELVALSKIEGKWEKGGSIKVRLVQPKTPNWSSYCDECPYRRKCHGQ